MNFSQSLPNPWVFNRTHETFPMISDAFVAIVFVPMKNIPSESLLVTRVITGNTIGRWMPELFCGNNCCWVMRISSRCTSMLTDTIGYESVRNHVSTIFVRVMSMLLSKISRWNDSIKLDFSSWFLHRNNQFWASDMKMKERKTYICLQWVRMARWKLADPSTRSIIRNK